MSLPSDLFVIDWVANCSPAGMIARQAPSLSHVRLNRCRQTSLPDPRPEQGAQQNRRASGKAAFSIALRGWRQPHHIVKGRHPCQGGIRLQPSERSLQREQTRNGPQGGSLSKMTRAATKCGPALFQVRSKTSWRLDYPLILHILQLLLPPTQFQVVNKFVITTDRAANPLDSGG